MSDSFSYPPRFMGRSEAARYMGVGVTLFDELMAEGVFPSPCHAKSKQIWDRVDLDRAAAAMPKDNRTVKEQMFDHYKGKI